LYQYNRISDKDHKVRRKEDNVHKRWLNDYYDYHLLHQKNFDDHVGQSDPDCGEDHDIGSCYSRKLSTNHEVKSDSVTNLYQKLRHDITYTLPLSKLLHNVSKYYVPRICQRKIV